MNFWCKVLLLGFILASLSQAQAAADEDDEQQETPSDFSMSGSFLLGTPSQGSSPQVNETSYYLNFEPEWAMTPKLSLCGTIMARQILSFDEGLYFNQSDVGIKYTGPEVLGFFYPTYSLAVLLPFNSQDVIQDSYRGGVAISIKLTHANATKGSETSLAISNFQLRHNSGTTVDDLINVHSYILATFASEYALSKMWTLGGNINYAVRHFYQGSDHAVTGFDVYSFLHIFSDSTRALVLGFGNYPNPQLPQDITGDNPAFNQNLNFIYLGITFEI